MRARKVDLWLECCEKYELDDLCPLIGEELMIVGDELLSLQTIMARLKSSYKREFNESLTFPSKKRVQKEFSKALYQMQKRGLIEIKEKIDSTRFRVQFIWLNNLEQAA